MRETFNCHQGNTPLLISFPHVGTEIPAKISANLNKLGKDNVDCDWYIDRLYEFILDMDISYVKPVYSRYVVDLNRSPQGELLYPGKIETGICALTTFAGNPIYQPAHEPDLKEITFRIKTYWQPYHNFIQQELARIKSKFGYAILWDAHSIYGKIPKLFNGVLPDLNFGTAQEDACKPSIVNKVAGIARQCGQYSIAVNDRFKGGYITRHYGNPVKEINAIQLEINQSAYMQNTNKTAIDIYKTQKLSMLLKQLIDSLLD